MADQTPFLDLVKPAGGEPVEILVINENMDKLDEWAEEQGDPNIRTRAFKGPANDRDTIVPNPTEGDTYREIDGKKILWERIGGNWVTSEGGLYLIRPTSVVGTGVTIDNAGHVALTNANTDIGILGVFSSRFDHYLVELLVDNASSDTGVLMKFKTGGVDIAAGYFGTYNEQAIGVPQTKVDTNNAASIAAGRISTGGGAILIDLFRPSKTVGTKDFLTRSGDSANYFRNGGGSLNSVAILDGITLVPAGITITTGRIKVYGYR